MKGRDWKGGGDSLFESIWFGLCDLVKDGLRTEIPDCG